MINQQIHITSVVKALYSAKSTGKLNLKIVNQFMLYKYYIDYTQELIDNGSNQFITINKTLKKEISKLQYKYPNDICNYKVIIPNNPAGVIDNSDDTGNTPNTAPTVSDNSVIISNSISFFFDPEYFLLNFSDNENDSYKYLIIYPSGLTNGALYYNNIELVNPFIINLKDFGFNEIMPLEYRRTNLNIFPTETFNFKVSDDNVNFLYSSIHTMGVSADTIEGGYNQPATIGDITLYRDNRETTIITLSMLTSQLTPPYNDPEGDLIDAIRIDEVSTANTGVFYFNGSPVQEGDIIFREDINNELFYHEGPDQDTINSDTINFSARDEGSKIWVQ